MLAQGVIDCGQGLSQSRKMYAQIFCEGACAFEPDRLHCMNDYMT